jgi:chorismate mutase
MCVKSSIKKVKHTVGLRNQTKELDILRKKIDVCDQKIIALLAQRFTLVKKIGLYKNKKNIVIWQSDRVEKVLDSRSLWGAKKKLSKSFVREIFYSIITYATHIEKVKHK